MSEAMGVPQDVGAVPPSRPPGALGALRSAAGSVRRVVGRGVGTLEVDTRMLGMIVALVVIWIGFDILSIDPTVGGVKSVFGGTFLTPQNLWNLSVQSASIAIMATGMVLIIVSRNIDLSVGSLLGFLGYVMAYVQAIVIPTTLGLGFDKPYTWIIALAIGLALGAVIGGVQGGIIAYGGVPAFIVTLGGYLVWRGLIFRVGGMQGQTIAPMDKTFSLIGGGPKGSLGDWPSWILGFLACAAIIWLLTSRRRTRQKYGFPIRPMWAHLTLIIVGCLIVLGAVYVANSYMWPPALASQYAADHHITEPPGGLQLATGIAIPVVIMVGVGLIMTIVATRLRFGRYVFAIGGNPDAAALAGIPVRRTIMMTYVLMGVLCGVSAAVSIARLDSAVTNLGVQNELDVIAAAVIGGTSFAGGIGTIPGAILGAIVMQSLRSGMLTLRVDSPTQDIVVGIVLVGAVGVDAFLRRRKK